MGASGPVAPLASRAAGLHAGRAVAYARAAMGRPRMFTYKATKGAPPGEITAVFSQHR
jgi:hypothetical protein